MDTLSDSLKCGFSKEGQYASNDRQHGGRLAVIKHSRKVVGDMCGEFKYGNHLSVFVYSKW